MEDQSDPQNLKPSGEKRATDPVEDGTGTQHELDPGDFQQLIGEYLKGSSKDAPVPELLLKAMNSSVMTIQSNVAQAIINHTKGRQPTLEDIDELLEAIKLVGQLSKHNLQYDQAILQRERARLGRQ